MCEKKPEDELYKFVLRYKYNLVELNAFLNSLENAETNKNYNKKQYKKRLNELKLKVISTILSITILTSVTFSLPKILNKDIYDNKVVTSILHTSYLSLIIYNLYINGYTLVLINKELKLRKNDYLESTDIYNEYVIDIIRILEDNEDIRLKFIRTYNRLGIYNNDLVSEFENYYNNELILRKELKGVSYE